MRLMQRLAISGLLSVILILLLTGTFVSRRDLTTADRGVAPEERNEQMNPAWVQDNVVPGQDEPESENRDKDKDRRLDAKHKQSEHSAVGPPSVSSPGLYVIRPPNPPLDDVTNQRREKVKEMMKHGWDNYVRYAWGKNELRPITKRGHSASIFGASNMGATIVDGLDTLYIMGLHDEFKQGRDWIAENLDFDILASFITNEYSMALFIEVLSFNILCVIYILKYIVVYFNVGHVKTLFDEVQYHWNLAQDANELEIIEKYANKGKFYTLFSGWIVYPGTFAFILSVCVPDILDIIVPLDQPRLRHLPIKIETFLDEDRYFYFLILVIMGVAFLGMTVLMATENMLMLLIQHACGLYELISHRLTLALDKSSSGTASSEDKCSVCVKLRSALTLHQQCLEFIESVQNKFRTSYFVLCVFGVASLSINMFRFLLALAAYNVYEIIASALFVYAHFCYIFWLNYFGQDLIDHSEWLFHKIWNTEWCTAPLHVQKLLFIMLQRSMKNSRIIIGSLFVASLEGFATLISMSLSYCMVIYSVRQ